MYLHYVMNTLDWGGRVLSVIALLTLAIGFIGSWLYSGYTYRGAKKSPNWEMKTRWLRNFFRFVAPPALIFGIPGLMVWFS